VFPLPREGGVPSRSCFPGDGVVAFLLSGRGYRRVPQVQVQVRVPPVPPVSPRVGCTTSHLVCTDLHPRLVLVGEAV
jgi:hypothetical protein